MAAARSGGVKRVVHTSSIAAIGTRPGEACADERTPFDDWRSKSDYVWSKVVSELEALRCDASGLEVVAVNPAFPFGPDDRVPTPTGRIVQEAVSRGFVVVPEGGINAVDVRDVATGHLLAAIRGQPGERYILGGHNLTYAELTTLVERFAGGRRRRRIPVSPAAFRALGRLGDVLARVLQEEQPVSHVTAVHSGSRYLYHAIDKARRELGEEVRPIEEAVEASVRWFEGRG